MTAAIVEHYAPVIGVAAYLLIIGGLTWLTTRKDRP